MGRCPECRWPQEWNADSRCSNCGYAVVGIAEAGITPAEIVSAAKKIRRTIAEREKKR